MQRRCIAIAFLFLVLHVDDVLFVEQRAHVLKLLWLLNFFRLRRESVDALDGMYFLAGIRRLGNLWSSP